jgi:hypothetical protein
VLDHDTTEREQTILQVLEHLLATQEKAETKEHPVGRGNIKWNVGKNLFPNNSQAH